jgi:hypothetical protein
METAFDQNHIDARETLFDAVEAPGPHRDAAILAGAQAVYDTSASADYSFAVAPFTHDADIALDPDLPANSPAIDDAMGYTGLRLTDQPGYGRGDRAQVDLFERNIVRPQPPPVAPLKIAQGSTWCPCRMATSEPCRREVCTWQPIRRSWNGRPPGPEAPL